MTIPDPFLALLGLALLLFGWVLYRTTLAMAGAALFGAAGALAGALLAGAMEWEGGAERAASLGGGLLLGALFGAWLLRTLHRIAFFLIGSVLGASAWLGLLGFGRAAGWEWCFEPLAAYGGPPAAALLGGLALLRLDRFLIAAATSVLGGLLAMEGAGWPLGGLPLLGLVPLGLAIQWGMGGPSRGEKKAKKDGDD